MKLQINYSTIYDSFIEILIVSNLCTNVITDNILKSLCIIDSCQLPYITKHQNCYIEIRLH